jgi:hypothetical protein
MKPSARRWGALAAFGLLCMPPQAASAAEPCKLLTVQEIGQALGASVSSATPLGATGCMWAGGSQRVSIVLRPATAWARTTMPVPGMTKTSVGGLGDAASVSGLNEAAHPGQDNVLTLSVRKGANVIVLTVYGVEGAERQRSAEEALARLALRRL